MYTAATPATGITLLVAVSVGLVATLPATAQSTSDVLLGQVRAAWAKRQDTVQTLRVTWTCKAMTPKGAISSELPIAMRKSGVNVSAIIPEADVVHNGGGFLLLDIGKARFKLHGFRVDGRKGEFVRFQSESVFDGTRFVRLVGSETQGHPSAAAKSSDHNGDGDELAISPMLLAVRGTTPAAACLSLNHYTQARQVTIANRSLIELTKPRDESRGEAKIWVDPSQDYAPVATEVSNRLGGLTSKRSISNSQVGGPSPCWLPERWTCSAWIPAGKLFCQIDVATQIREINVATSNADFELVLPAGTVLSEDNGKKSEHSIIREDGSKRVIAPSELNTPYEELIRADSASRSWLYRWQFLLGSFISVVAVCLLLRRRRARQSGTPPSSPSTTP